MTARMLAWALLLGGASCSVYDASDLTGARARAGGAPAIQGGSAGSGVGGSRSGGGAGGVALQSGGGGGQLEGNGGSTAAGRGGGSPTTQGGSGGSVAAQGGSAGTASPSGGADEMGGVPPVGSTAGSGGEPMVAEGGSAGVAPIPTSGSGGVEEPATGGQGGATAGAGAGGATGCTPPTTGESCAHDAAPKLILLDFSTYDDTDGSWGNASSGDLTGGTDFYSGGGASPLVLALEGTGAAAVAHLTGTLPASGYAGAVFWFGPCVDASQVTGDTTPTTGLSFPLGGTSTARLDLQVQTHETHPVDAGRNKGACLFTDCVTQWSECLAPKIIIATIPATAADYPVLWSELTPGAIPGDASVPTDGDGVIGLQFQFECRLAVDCSIDVTIGLIELTL